MPKTILITGASSGIGRATAVYFAEREWNVVATMRNPEKVDVNLKKPNIFITALDITDDATIVTAVAVARKRFGKIDVLLNNAGYGLFGALEAMSAEQINKQLHANIFGLMRVTQQIIPVMREQGQGIIVNISSIGGRMGFPYGTAYHATKFAVEGLSESLRYELEPFGIRVKIIEPGAIATDFLVRGMDSAVTSVYAKSFNKMLSMLGKLSKNLPGPEHVAKTIFHATNDRFSPNRLRYAAKPGPFLFLQAILPDWLKNKVLRIMI